MTTPSTGQSRADLLVQSVTDYAIYMIDPSGIVSSWNAGAERFKGYKAEEIIGRHFSVFYPESDKAAGLPQRALGIALAEGRFEAEGWRSARTEPASGPTSSSIRSATKMARISASPRSRAISASGAKQTKRFGRARSASACSSRASPITQSTCLILKVM